MTERDDRPTPTTSDEYAAIQRHRAQMKNSVTVNGVTVSGRSVVVSNGRVLVDGKDVTLDAAAGKTIKIVVAGDIQQLSVDACTSLEITGNVGSVSTVSGDVNVEGIVKGSVQTVSGDVDCGSVAGNVSTVSGKIKHGG